MQRVGSRCAGHVVASAAPLSCPLYIANQDNPDQAVVGAAQKLHFSGHTRPGPMLPKLPRVFDCAVPWPTLEAEIGSYKAYLKGTVLNAGAGDRDLAPLVDGTVYNQDLPGGRHNGRIDIWSPLHSIPVECGFFDVVFCNAVLEHVENPHAVVEEFQRVLKPGGILYLCVPFLQPEHLDPGDFQRYTQSGLRKLVEDHGFDVVKTDGIHTVYHTLTWIVAEWLTAKRTLIHLALRIALLPVLRYKARHSHTFVHSIASGYRVLARKR